MWVYARPHHSVASQRAPARARGGHCGCTTAHLRARVGILPDRRSGPTPAQVGGTQVHKFSIDPESLYFDQASRVISWIEEGIFDALVNGYLEKCMLVVAHDEKCEHPIEVWDLSLTWEDDVATPQIGRSSGRPDQGRQSLSGTPAPGPSRSITKDDVRKAAQIMMRRLSCMLQGLEEIPTDHWIGMRVLYRDGVTPKEYEPTGFHQSSSAAGRFVFQSPPTFVSAGRLTTGHNSLSVGVALAEVPGFEPTDRNRACTSSLADGGYTFDLVRATSNEAAGTPPPVADTSMASAGEQLPELVDMAASLLSGRVGSEVTAHALALELHISPTVAEEVLQELQGLEMPIVSTLRQSTRSREVIDPEAYYAASQADASSCHGGTAGEASWVCVPFPVARSRSAINTPAPASSRSQGGGARPMKIDTTPQTGPTAEEPTRVQRAKKPSPAQAAQPRPARESAKAVGKRKASQVLEPIGRASRAHV